MLKKLLRYDLENVFKVLKIFYILALFFSILTRLFLSIDNSFIMSIIGKICTGVTISMICNILINNLMRLWFRFKNNFYGDESYLTHTLPINKKTLYLSKVITSVITLFVSILVIGLSLFVAYYSKENIEILKGILLPLADTYGSTIIKILLAALFVFFLEFANVLQTGYTGIILGHRMNTSKIGFSILFGFSTYIVTQMFALLMMFIIALFNKNIMNLFYTVEMIDVGIIKVVILMAVIIYIIILVLCYFINLKLFSKGVNVD